MNVSLLPYHRTPVLQRPNKFQGTTTAPAKPDTPTQPEPSPTRSKPEPAKEPDPQPTRNPFQPGPAENPNECPTFDPNRDYETC